jgi:CHAT domain-containing protein
MRDGPLASFNKGETDAMSLAMLLHSGIALAGANRPRATADAGKPEGILTAEEVEALDLRGTDLVLLSACETGLGAVEAGEGVMGLQRAFHGAGARNVVASLWRVDDQATAALMGLFYRNLWVEKRPPQQALREAQLYILRHPDRIATLAGKRGVDFAKLQDLPPDDPGKTAPSAGKEKRAKVSQWAAFVLSGVGD